MIKIIWFSVLILIFTSCSNDKKNVLNNTEFKELPIPASSFDSIKIKESLNKNEIFRWLDTQSDYVDSSSEPRTKTSAALYYWKEKDSLEIPEYYFYNNCRAEIVQDTLIIRIGTTNYLADYGMKVKYKNEKFNVQPYRSNDVLFDDPFNREKNIVRNRTLILDKKHYKNGDSIYGRIHAEIEQAEAKNSLGESFVIEHIVDGFFRAKVGED